MLNDTANWKSWDSTTTNLKPWIPIGNDRKSLIKNVKVNASYINGDFHVGGIAGRGSGGTVLNSTFEGTINGRVHVGGIVGSSDNYSYNKISNSYFIGIINAYSHVGGIIGDNQGKVLNCYSKGNIKGNNTTGGIVGYNWYGTVMNTYSTSIVNVEEDDGGGIAGGNRGMLTNSYFAGSVNGDKYVGGIVGWNGGVFQNDTEIGIGKVYNAYWDIITNIGKNAVGGNSEYANGLNTVDAKGMTTDGMKSLYFVETLNVFVDSANMAQTDFIYSRWALDIQNVNQGYPIFEAFQVW